MSKKKPVVKKTVKPQAASPETAQPLLETLLDNLRAQHQATLGAVHSLLETMADLPKYLPPGLTDDARNGLVEAQNTAVEQLDIAETAIRESWAALEDREGQECQHQPDFSTVNCADLLVGGEGIVDVKCKRCGVSGSFKVTPADVEF